MPVRTEDPPARAVGFAVLPGGSSREAGGRAQLRRMEGL